MKKTHHYKIMSTWHGNKGSGTSSVSAYERSHTIENNGKPALELTTDNPKFGDKNKLNPEDLVLSALSSCHLMSFLYLCAEEGISVTAYRDEAEGTMVEDLAVGGGKFTEVTLHPVFSVADPSMKERALALHEKAHKICYIANSVNFPVKHDPRCE
jgi:organic hydroperoxide reductase OsmC/OhrA